MSTFEKLAAVNVNEHLEKKGNFSYLSWAWAVDAFRKACPDATWEVVRHDGLPYMKTECGYFVEVAVTAEGIKLSQIHPVLNHQHKPIPQPNAFDINTSIQRCLVKAIALHGLGLYIYAGEDLPSDGRGDNDDETHEVAAKAEQVSTDTVDVKKVENAVIKAIEIVDSDDMDDGPDLARKLYKTMGPDEQILFKEKLTASMGKKMVNGVLVDATFYSMFKKYYDYKPSEDR